MKLDYTYFHQHSLTRTSTEYDGHKDTNEYSLNYSLPIGKTDLSVKSYYFDYSTETESRKYNSTTGAYDRFYYDYDIPRDDWGLMLEASTELGSHRVTVGTDLKWGKCDSRYTYATGKRDFGGKQDLYSLYVNDEMFAGDKVVLSAGLRYDYWKNHDADFYDDTTDKPYAFPYPDKNDDAWSPRAGVVYKVREDTRLRTSFGTGFKAPSLYNLYRSGPHGSTRFDLANPGLGPEKMTWSYDAGFDMEPNDNLSLTLTWYQSSFKDFLGDRTVDPDELPPYIPPGQFDPDMAIIQKVNMGKIDIYGVEAGFEVAFNSKWSAFVNHTYNVSKIKKYQEAPEDEGNYLSYCPKNVTKIGFIYDNPAWFTLGIYLTNVGSRYTDFKNSDTKKLEGYQVIDMKILREIFKGMEVFLSLDNVTDEDYSEYRSATTITYCPPFTAMLGVKYDF
ncbi:MAG: hypothetical protein BA865_06845 [Desulfobacterales bacterium S5133MH4]|nr:MAG: hypothetical protein BA865_06845 [Desulfobacterales bacterium S5133MH4]